MSPQKFTVTYEKESFTGYEMIEKTATAHGNGARVVLPVTWKGKRVRVILLDLPEKS